MTQSSVNVLLFALVILTPSSVNGMKKVTVSDAILDEAIGLADFPTMLKRETGERFIKGPYCKTIFVPVAINTA